jgi:hypothetical protein
MKGYTNIFGNFYDEAKRNASTPLINKAIADGILLPLTDAECKWCGQTEGIRHYHCEDYDNPVEDSVCLCWRCHMVWHSRFRAPSAAFKYVYEVTMMGKQYPPVFKHNFNILREHGV